ncbi:hypothetical protein CpPA04_1468 [Corynebacterium pseudotuberculosis]|nr:hypothetical protein CpPA04_1468 [Corynebacterium pseudotuberculosis]ATQ65788.1 Hypothetical protein CpPA07_1489 [Corynebacterium pseudotuberculosis]
MAEIGPDGPSYHVVGSCFRAWKDNATSIREPPECQGHSTS